jgi:hypothetical protein
LIDVAWKDKFFFLLFDQAGARDDWEIEQDELVFEKEIARYLWLFFMFFLFLTTKQKAELLVVCGRASISALLVQSKSCTERSCRQSNFK